METLYSIFDGLMVSDGHLCLGKYAVSARYKHSCKFKEYVTYLMRLMGEASVSFYESNPYRVVHENINQAVTYYIQSRSTPFFTREHRRWYKNNVKIVPDDFVITPDVMRHWFMGDGSLHYSNRVKPCWGVRLHADGFSKVDRAFLQEKLRAVGFPTTVNKRGNLYIGTACKKAFFAYIGVSPVKCFEYKWVTEDYQLYKQMRVYPFYNEDYDKTISSGSYKEIM